MMRSCAHSHVCPSQGSGARRPLARAGRTAALVDSRGHLLPHLARRYTAFVSADEAWLYSSARWPQVRQKRPPGLLRHPKQCVSEHMCCALLSQTQP